MALETDAFTTELARRIGGFLGEIKLSAPRQAYPLSLQMAERYTDTRLVLVGDAAHAIHPIAGQGLNMGLRDAAALADVVNYSAGSKTPPSLGCGCLRTIGQISCSSMDVSGKFSTPYSAG